jgi:hypothetical protein
MVTMFQDWSDPSAAHDRDFVEAMRPADYPPDVWEFLIEHRARALIARKDFGETFGRLVVSLEEHGALTGDEIAALSVELPVETSTCTSLA